MPISNVALTNTFDQWRTTTNQLATTLNDLLNDGAPTITYRNITANNVFANNINIGTVVISSNTIRLNTIVSNVITSNTVTVNTVIANTINLNGINVQTYIASSYDQANVARTHANAAFANANSAGVVASAAFDRGNTAVLKTGNTMTGNLVMSGANIAFATATNSGIYWSGTSFVHSPGANRLVLGTSGVHVFEITSTANVNFFDNTLRRPILRDYSITRVDLGNATGSVTIDLEAGNFFTATSTGTTTWTFSNPPTGVTAGGFIIELTNGGSQTQNWPTTATKWPGGVAPTLTSSGVDLLVFVTDDGGTTWRGVASMLDSK